MEDHKFQGDEICSILLRQRSAALRVCAQANSVAVLLAERIALANGPLGGIRLSLQEITEFAQTDYRLIARALHARRHSTKALKRRWCGESEPRVHFVNTLDELCDSGDVLTILLNNHGFDRELSVFLQECNGVPGLFVEEQFDIPNRNAVFRDGVVKSWHLPHGTCVVSKRDNKRKQNRLLEEQRNLALILERLHAWYGAHIALGRRAEDTYFTISRPICLIRDPATTFCYAISLKKPGETLEELLLNTKVPHESRQQHLKNYRLCLDFLFENGIVWRDMSPRNVLVEQNGCILYHFVDFEKVDVWDGPLSLQSRIDACRAQFCVEEFGVISLREELLDTFSGLFLPDQWDLQSGAPLPFPPRVEIAAVLAGRGIEQVSIGEFNRLDQQIQEVRCPRIDPTTGNLVRPGLLGFRVEHYLSLSADIDSSDYDRKTTEVLLAAHAINRLIQSVHCLSTYVDNLEAAIIVAEFDAILQNGNSRFIKYSDPEALRLCAAIDVLYASIHDPAAFSSALSNCSSKDA
jgi:hypothetical protein